MVTLTAELTPGYRVKVVGQTSGLWTMTVTGRNGARLQFSNVYATVENALDDAETFACYALESWGMTCVSAIQWSRGQRTG